jgi:hypothetical protein
MGYTYFPNVFFVNVQISINSSSFSTVSILYGSMDNSV